MRLSGSEISNLAARGIARLQRVGNPVRAARSLRNNILFLLAFILLVVATAVGVGVFIFVDNSEKSAWHDRQLEATYSTARAINNFFAQHIRTLQSIGLLESGYLETHPEHLAQLHAQNPALQEIVVINPDGTILSEFHTDEAIIAQPSALEDVLWLEYARSGNMYLGDIYTPARSTPFILLAIPVETGSQQGNVIAARLNMEILREITASTRFGETGIAMIIDREGRVIAHSEHRPEDGDLYLGVTPDNVEDTTLPIYAMADERIGITHWHSNYDNFAGTRVAALILKLPGTSWYVVAEVDWDETHAISRTALTVLGGSLALVGLLVFLVTVYLLDRQLFGPIARLRAGAYRIGTGALTHRIPVVGDNEIDQLATAFNEMAASLQNRRQELIEQASVLESQVEQRRQAQADLQQAHNELEAKVAARTRELSDANQRLHQELEQRRQAQEALANAEARLQHLLLTSPAIIYSVKFGVNAEDAAAVTYISHNIEEATGFTPQAYYATPDFAMTRIHPEDVPGVEAALARLPQSERVSFDYRFRVRDGTYKWFHDDAVAVYDEEGRLREMVGSLVDIDARKRMEDEQARAHDQALEASRLKSEFLTTVSHEIRTPLNGVIGMADLLLTTPVNAEQLEFIQTIGESAHSLLTIINDVLDLSKVEAGKLSLLETEFSPAQVAQNVIDLLAPRAREKGLELRFTTDPDPTDPDPTVPDPTVPDPTVPDPTVPDPTDPDPTVPDPTDPDPTDPDPVDTSPSATIGAQTGAQTEVRTGAQAIPQRALGYEARVRQVLLNLVGNAVKFTEQGSVTVHIERVCTSASDCVSGCVSDGASGSAAADMPDAGSGDMSGATRNRESCTLRFVVRDTGIGISQTDIGKLFQPFSQVDSSQARKHGGAGLGLAISKRLVELMGGDIGFAPQADQGAVFWFSVPVYPRTDDTPEHDAPEQDTPRQDAPAQDETVMLPAIVQNSPQGELSTPAPSAPDNTAPDNSAPDNTSRRILLVEDNRVNQRVMLAQLKRLDYRVHAVNNGREAVEASAENTYSLILMDCQMPEMDGFEATHHIRRQEANPNRHVPIVAITANAMNGDRDACLAAGMDDYLAKPFRVQELEILLQRWTAESTDRATNRRS